MSKANTIIEKAMADIISHIRYEIELIHRAVNANDEDGIHTEEEDWTYNPTIMVEVQDPYSMDRYDEPRLVTSLSIEDDGDISVGVFGNYDISINEVSIEGLAKISNCLEEAYNHLISK